MELKDLPAARTGQEVPDYNYFCRETGERLPKRGTAPQSRACLMKRYRERGSLQLATVDVRPHFLPTLSRAGDARHGSKDAGELLPTKANSGWQHTLSSEEKIKQYLEKDKFQLKESSTADLRPTRLPTIKTPGAPAGRHSAPTGVESSKNRGKETGKRLPRLDTAKSRYTEQENSKGNLQRTLLPTITTKNTPAVKICSSRVVLRPHMTVTGEPLPRFATKQTKMIKREQEHLIDRSTSSRYSPNPLFFFI